MTPLFKLLVLAGLCHLTKGQSQQAWILAQPSKPRIDEPLTLTCVPFDDSPPVRSCNWLNDFSSFAEFGGNCTVDIASVNQSYIGSYVCIAVTDQGLWQSAAYYIEVSRPLIPTLESSSPPYVPRGSSLYLSCSSANSSVLFYNFYKDDILVDTTSWNILQYNPHYQDDLGRFSCSAFNIFGESDKSIELIFTAFGQPQVISNIDVPDLGDNLTLTCDPTVPISSDFIIKWEKNVEYMNHTGPTLTLETLQEEDAGVYNCELDFDNRLGVPTLTSQHGFVIVFDAPLPPSLTVLDDPVMHMSDLWFSCYPNTTEHGIIRSALYFNGLKVGERSLSKSFSGPALHRAMGSYSCSVFNKWGESSQSSANDITIENWAPSNRSVLVGEYFQRRGSVYSASCSSSSLIQRNIADYCSLFINGERYAQSTACSLIRIPHDSDGDVQCSATNDNGTSGMSPAQSVRYFDAPVIRPVNQTHPVLGESYILKCVTDAEGSSIQFEWFKGYTWKPILHTGQDFLIDPVDESKEHEYRCKVTQRINGRSFSVFSPLFDFSISSLSTRVSNIQRYRPSILCSSSLSTAGATLYKDGMRMSEADRGYFNQVFLSERQGVSLTCRVHTFFGPIKLSDDIYVTSQDDEIQVLSNPPIASLGQSLTLTCSSTVTENATFVWEIKSPSFESAHGSVSGRVLNLDPVTYGDSGVYICQVIVESPEGRRTLNSPQHLITFSAPFAPHFSIISSENAPDWTTHLGCQCRHSDCDPLNPFRLYRDGVLVPMTEYDEIYTFNYILTQRFSVTGNAGNYTCTAVNYVGESGPSFPVAIEARVELSLTADNPLPSLGDDVTMTCTLSRDSPEYNIIWYMNSKQLLRTGKTLTLNRLTQEDHGVYYCSFDSVQSNPHMIIFRAPLQPILFHMKSAGHERSARPSYYVMDSMMFQAVAEGDQVLLSCFSESPRAGYLPTSVTNANQVYSLWSEGQLIMDNDQDGDFTVTAPSVGDYPYRCQSRNDFGSSEMSWPTVVKVDERPVIQSSKSPELVNIGDNISLSCETTQNSDGYDITWKKNGQDLLEIRPTLVLNSVNEYDEGIYTCHQKVGSWIFPSSAGLTLLPLDRAARPDLYSSEGSTSSLLGPRSKLRLYCLSSSTTANIATFKFRGTAIATLDDPDYDDASQIQFTYEMDNVQVSDSGNYTCTVTNADGESLDSEPFSLTVDVCEAGKWGPECTKDCSGNCDGTGVCDKATGHCTDGCKPGYKNDLCDTPCEHPFYGDSCKMTCSVNCRNSSIQQETPSTLCHHVNGQCLLGCQGSFYGPTCEGVDDDDDSDDDDFEVNTLTIVLFVAVAILVLVVVVTITLYIRERRRRSSTTKTGVTSMSDSTDGALQESVQGNEMKNSAKTDSETQGSVYTNEGFLYY